MLEVKQEDKQEKIEQKIVTIHLYDEDDSEGIGGYSFYQDYLVEGDKETKIGTVKTYRY